MSAYNAEEYINEAIDSILHQTFADFEFLIINDDSTDSTQKIISSYSDPRIRLIVNEKNIGMTLSFNKGLELAKGEYIARMDADDVSLPKRLEVQVRYMDQNPTISMCGTFARVFGDKNIIFKQPLSHEAIKSHLLYNSAFAHPSVVIRSKDFKKYNLSYDGFFQCAQDYDLWERAIWKVRMANIPRILLNYRIKEAGKSKFYLLQNKEANIIKKRQLLRLGLDPSEEEMQIHHNVAKKLFERSDKTELIKARGWLEKIIEANKKTQLYDQKPFVSIASHYWFCACLKSPQKGFWLWNNYHEFKISNLKQKIVIFKKAFLFKKPLSAFFKDCKIKKRTNA